jgi:hypothetical protein
VDRSRLALATGRGPRRHRALLRYPLLTNSEILVAPRSEGVESGAGDSAEVWPSGADERQTPCPIASAFRRELPAGDHPRRNLRRIRLTTDGRFGLSASRSSLRSRACNSASRVTRWDSSPAWPPGTNTPITVTLLLSGRPKPRPPRAADRIRCFATVSEPGERAPWQWRQPLARPVLSLRQPPARLLAMIWRNIAVKAGSLIASSW